MTEWPYERLGDIADILVGYAFKSSQFTTSRGDVRALRGANVHQGFTDWHQEARWPASEAYDPRYELAEGDVVLAMDRPWIEAGLKRARLRTPDLPALLVQRVARLRGTEVALTSFVHHTLATEHFSRFLQAQVTGATVPHISQTQIASYELRLPPIEVQTRICAVLDAFDDLIDNNRRRVEVLEEMARAIYREWFVKFRYPGHEEVPLVNSELGQIPKGWDVVPASVALVVNPRIKVDKSVEHPFIAMGDLDVRSMACYSSTTRVGNSGAKFQNGDTLFARITPCLENGKTGFVCSLDGGEVGLGSTEFVVLRGQRVGPVFTYCLSRSDEFRGNAIASMSGASGRQRVRNECFDSYLVALPPREIADLFEERAQPLFAEVDLLHQQSARLAGVRDLLLPKLVTGQIDVSTLELDALVEEAVA